jgi:riboflavin synthase
MFTGIVETTGKVVETQVSGSNRSFWVESPISGELKIDQSISHNGACLTIDSLSAGRHRVTAIEETLKKTDLGTWIPGTLVNLERSLRAGDRIDGHFVQGHVDCTATCTDRQQKEGSWEYKFEFPKSFGSLVIEKGSVTVNGISLTCFDVKKKSFRVAIIPYTFEHTNIRLVEKGQQVNLEFDITGKYILRSLSLME